MGAITAAEAGEGLMKRRVSTIADASMPLLARSFHRFASLLLFPVGYGWFFSPPKGALPEGDRRQGSGSVESSLDQPGGPGGGTA